MWKPPHFFTISPCCEKSTFFIGKNVLLINNCPPIYTFYTKAFFSVLISMTIHSVFCEPQKKNSKLDQKKNWTSIIFNSLCFCIRCICIHAYYGWKINTCEQPFLIITIIDYYLFQFSKFGIDFEQKIDF